MPMGGGSSCMRWGTRPYESYFSGGYCLARYSSYAGGPVDGIQLECPWYGVRDTTDHLQQFAASLAEILKQYLDYHGLSGAHK